MTPARFDEATRPLQSNDARSNAVPPWSPRVSVRNVQRRMSDEVALLSSPDSHCDDPNGYPGRQSFPTEEALLTDDLFKYSLQGHDVSALRGDIVLPSSSNAGRGSRKSSDEFLSHRLLPSLSDQMPPRNAFNARKSGNRGSKVDQHY